MKKILGLDLGTNSIGWALVNEAQDKTETSKIIKMGVRIIQYDTFNKIDKQGNVSESKNPIMDFETGKGLSPNAKRTKQRGARRNLQRYKQRRKNLIDILLKSGLIAKDTSLTETGKNTTHQLIRLRAKSAKEKIEKQEFARVLLAINKKRGYRSSRKVKSEDEGNLIDGMSIAKVLYENNQTPGQYVYSILEKGNKYIPDFYRSDLQSEFNKIWAYQRQFFPEILTAQLKEELQNKNKTQTWAICAKPFNISGINQKGSANEKRIEKYHWRAEALSKKIDLEYLAIVLSEINNNINHSSGYLGAISDRSKELYFNKETVGEYLFRQLRINPHTQLKNQVFYRQDYLDEFEQIWETQAKYHNELTTELKKEIRDVIIFFQRKLKSQKGLISFCEFESWEEKYTDKLTGKRKKRQVGHKVIPKSSPLFQEFKIWQILNNLTLENTDLNEKITFSQLDDEVRQVVFEELNTRGNLKLGTIINLLGLKNPKGWTSNYTELEGNRTNERLYNVYQKIAEIEGYGHDWARKTATEIKDELKNIFPIIGINSKILDFNPEIEGDKFDKQESYLLWHLLYSAEDNDEKDKNEKDKLKYGHINTALKKKLHLKYGFKPEYANMMANVNLQQDYGNLSAKAIKKIIPFLKAGHIYSEAAKLAGYNHSHSLDKEALSNRKLNEKLELLKKNSLRNPVVEKILNQMVNLINQLIEVYGKPDEIRIELARELKKSANERQQMAKSINAARIHYEEIKKILQKDFDIKNPTRNDIIRYRLYEELRENGYKTLYLNNYIPREKLFSREIDIEHIIPKAKLFDDSFSNKTLAYHKPNQDKDKMTALDFIRKKHSDLLDEYKLRIEKIYAKGKGNISRAKYKKLLMQEKDLPNDFLERDLRNSQYIAKKAKQMLEEVVRTVNTTTGSITNKLREDWDLINIMKELNLPKYRILGMTYFEERKAGQKIEKIKDWTKRNDHRHHAMDALTVAFTSYDHVQYLNNLKATSGEKEELNLENSKLYRIKNKITKLYEQKNGTKKRKFIPPLPNFREEAKFHIENILISIKANNKVVTRNKNKIRIGKDKYLEKIQWTPRGQLHNETIYGKIKKYKTKEEKIGTTFDFDKIKKVANPVYRETLLKRLEKCDGNPKKAFGGKNSITKTPAFIDESKTLKVPERVKLVWLEEIYTIRKDITPDLKTNKIIDIGIKKTLNNRLKEYNEDAKKAFSNLNENPIWFNKEKGITIKRVTITGVSHAIPLHYKRNYFGNKITNKNGEKIPVDYVNTGNNHHVAIYEDETGGLHEKVVSFFEAVERKKQGMPVVDKNYNADLGWKFIFALKQNEYFVFPSQDFDPQDIDLLNPDNTSQISSHLFRVQKISKKNYVFNHHLETKTVDGELLKTKKELSGKTYQFIQTPNNLKGIIKIRINHLGQIVHVGEY